MYIRQIQILKPLTMKILCIAAFFCISLGYANTNSENEKEKNKKAKKDVNEEKTLGSRNFHSIKKWKITVEYTNGEMISIQLVLDKNSSISPMENAFMEAESYTKTLKNVKSYNVSPVANNGFVLLAE